MIHDVKPYPAYKDFGVPWLGKVPEHWESGPASAGYIPKFVKNTGMVEKSVLSLSYGQIIVKSADKLHGLVPESFETYQIVDPDNIIVRTTDLQNDQTSLRVGFSRHRGIITSAYLCLRVGGVIPWVTPKDMKRAMIVDTQMRVTEAALEQTSLRRIPAGAVLLVVRGMILARRVPIARTTGTVTINQDMKAIVPNDRVEPAFLAHSLDSDHTRVVLFAPRPLSRMDKADRVWAVYLHACLRYVNRGFLTNTSVRERFGIEPQNIAAASRLIREAVDAGAIVAYDPDAAPKLMRYVPFWAAPRLDHGT